MSLSESIKEALQRAECFSLRAMRAINFKKKFRRSRNFSRALPVTEISIWRISEKLPELKVLVRYEEQKSG